MKPYILLFAFLCFISCTTENVPVLDNPVADTGINSKAKKVSFPANPSNPYDFVGYTYAAILDQLIDYPQNWSMANIFSLCEDNTAFQQMYSSGYVAMTDAELLSVFTAAELDIDQYIDSTALSEEGKNLLRSLVDNLVAIKTRDEQYDIAYNFLTGFENDIELSDLDSDDKHVLLVTCSILRHGYYMESRKRRRDRDWELSIGHIAATSYGAEIGEANSITAALGGRFVLGH